MFVAVDIESLHRVLLPRVAGSSMRRGELSNPWSRHIPVDISAVVER